MALLYEILALFILSAHCTSSSNWYHIFSLAALLITSGRKIANLELDLMKLF